MFITYRDGRIVMSKISPHSQFTNGASRAPMNRACICPARALCPKHCLRSGVDHIAAAAHAIFKSFFLRA